MNMKPILFYLFSFVIILFALLSVTTTRVLRAAVYLLFVLVATAGIYFLFDYFFLAAVQLTLYAGGIMVLIIFAVMLTNSAGEKLQKPSLGKGAFAALASVAGFAVFIFTYFSYGNFPAVAADKIITVRELGTSLVNYGSGGFVLPFEVISILLLAAMVAAIIIAKKTTK